jgi:uncharacterized membrane protein YedE/YeeE
MRPLRPLHAALLPLLPVALFVLGWLGLTSFQQTLGAGRGLELMMGWTLVFVVGLPISLVVLAVAGRPHPRRHGPAIVPSKGGKIP